MQAAGDPQQVPLGLGEVTGHGSREPGVPLAHVLGERLPPGIGDREE